VKAKPRMNISGKRTASERRGAKAQRLKEYDRFLCALAAWRLCVECLAPFVVRQICLPGGRPTGSGVEPRVSARARCRLALRSGTLFVEVSVPRRRPRFGQSLEHLNDCRAAANVKNAKRGRPGPQRLSPTVGRAEYSRRAVRGLATMLHPRTGHSKHSFVFFAPCVLASWR
jgi:hypothetical protein